MMQPTAWNGLDGPDDVHSDTASANAPSSLWYHHQQQHYHHHHHHHHHHHFVKLGCHHIIHLAIFLCQQLCCYTETSWTSAPIVNCEKKTFINVLCWCLCNWPVPMAQWAKPLFIGHSACCADGLRALADLSSTPGLEGSFSARLD